MILKFLMNGKDLNYLAPTFSDKTDISFLGLKCIVKAPVAISFLSWLRSVYWIATNVFTLNSGCILGFKLRATAIQWLNIPELGIFI